MVNKLLDILRNTQGIKDVIYNDQYRINFQLDKASFPCAVITIIPEINIDIKRYVHEKASVNLAVITQCPLDWEGIDIQEQLNECKNAIILAIGKLNEEFNIDQEIKLSTLLPVYDDHLCGFSADLQIEEKQPKCFSAYAEQPRIFDNTFDLTFN